jgi:Domain of unknown function (DUF4384)
MVRIIKNFSLFLLCLLLPFTQSFANELPDSVKEKLYVIRIRDNLGTDQHQMLILNLEKLVQLKKSSPDGKTLSQIYNQYLDLTQRPGFNEDDFNAKVDLSRLNSVLFAYLEEMNEIQDPDLIRLNEIENYLDERSQLTAEKSKYLLKLEAIRNNLVRKVVAQYGVQGASPKRKSRSFTSSSDTGVSSLIEDDKGTVKTRALRKSCYIVVEKSGNVDPKTVESLSVSLVSKYLRKVRAAPPAGLRGNECIFRAVLTESAGGFNYTISGKSINSLGSSKQTGIDGLSQSVLRAIYLSSDDASLKNRICNDHSNLMRDDCQKVGVVIAFYNEQGNEIADNSTVREGDTFYVMVKPHSTLYARVINKDAAGNFFQIFPNRDIVNLDNPLTKGKEYFFPPLGSSLIFKFDEKTGDELFYFVMTPTPATDIDQVLQKMNQGSAQDRSSAARLFEQRLLNRGFTLGKKKVKFRSNGEGEHTPASGDLLDKTGGFVEVVRLKHVR